MRLPRAALLLLLALAASPVFAERLIVLHTSDLHGRVHPHDVLADRDFGQGLARVATAVKRIRSEGAPVLLLDSGDTIEGSPTQALAFSGAVGDGSDPIVRAMNLIRYDAMAVGNHEFDFGRARLERSRREARFPWLSANILRENGEPAFPPYVVKEVGGVRVGVLGLITHHVPFWEGRRVTGLKFLDSVATARKFVPLLRKQERCHLVIVLTHQGFEKDPATRAPRAGAGENQAYALATEVSGVDLVLTGHTHRTIEPQRLGQTWVSQPGRFGEVLTRFDVKLFRREGGFGVAEIAGRNLSMREVPPDPAVVAAVEPEHRGTVEKLGERIATVAAPVSAQDARTADTAILDWLHSVQRREGKADLSFASLLPGALSPWEGAVTLREVWAFYPFENTLVTVRATGREVREALEQAALCVSGIETRDGEAVWRRNPAVVGYNCDTLDGAEYVLDPTRPERERVVLVKRNGAPVRDEDLFTVALNSYRASGGGGFRVWRDCPRVSESKQTLRDLLIEDARRKGILELQTNRNWFLSPSLPEGRPAVSP